MWMPSIIAAGRSSSFKERDSHWCIYACVSASQRRDTAWRFASGMFFAPYSAYSQNNPQRGLHARLHFGGSCLCALGTRTVTCGQKEPPPHLTRSTVRGTSPAGDAAATHRCGSQVRLEVNDASRA
jgi:hypothetical protein